MSDKFENVKLDADDHSTIDTTAKDVKHLAKLAVVLIALPKVAGKYILPYAEEALGKAVDYVLDKMS